MRRHHVIGAGFLASAIGLYPVASRLGLVPSDLSSVVGWITNTGGPLIPGLPTGVNGSATFGPAATNPVPYASDGRSAGSYSTSGYPSSAYPNSVPQSSAYQTSAYPSNGYAGANYGAGDIACFFSPAGGCTGAVVAEIGQARQQILVQAYSFTSAPIATALVEAHNRGVAVYVVLDKSQKTEQYSSADFVARAGIPTLIDAAHAIAHNKIMLIDRQTIITGSFNFTNNAEKSNAENLLVIRNRPDLYQAYENNFRHHYEHSQPYQGHVGNSQPPTHTYMPTPDGRVNGYSATNDSQGWGSPLPQAMKERGPTGYPQSVFR